MARQRKSTGSAAAGEGSGAAAEQEGKRPEALPSPAVQEERPAPLSPMDVLVELSRMATDDAGGSCVLFRKPPAVSPALHAEIRRLCLAEPGARAAEGLPAYCFNREATAVIADIVKGLGR